MLSKDQWFIEMERIQAELEEEGYSEAEAYRLAGERAGAAVADRWADKIDMLRLVKKEGAL